MTDWLLVAVVALAVSAGAMTITAFVAYRLGRVAVVDVTWGLALVAVAWACAALGTGWEPWLVAALVTLWGSRLAWHILRRSRGKGEDPRYAEILGVSPEDDKGRWFRTALRKVFLVQGAAVWLVSLPLQAAAVSDSFALPVVIIGLAVWALGVVFETVGDAQLAAYKADPDRGPVMDQGLWAWTRHPNYFGDSAVWWGIWLVGAVSTGWLPALLTVAAPVTMTYFLAFATGARLLERTMMQRPGYPEYAERTSMFVPLPPRR